MSQQYLIKALLAEFVAEHKVPYSREFIFGSEERCTRLRNKRIFRGPNGSVTLLSAMLRYGLDDTKRANLFYSPYHLASAKKIPQSRLTLASLANKVREEKHKSIPKKDRRFSSWNDAPESLKKEFESITDALKSITGKTFGNYENKENALRVIYLIDRLMTDPSIAIEGRSKRLLTFIKTPTKNFAFEARDAYPIVESEENTFLLNDLKSYIGIELSNDKQDRIDALFYSLIDRVDAIRSHLDELAYSSGIRLRISNEYRSIHGIVAASDDPSRESPSSQPTRLDEDLYLHLNRFEFLHFAGAHAEILDVARPPSPIVPVQDEMIAALSILTGGTRTYAHTHINNFWLAEFPELVKKNTCLFLDLIEASLGFRPTESKYKRSISLAYELLYRNRVFGGDFLLPGEPVKVNFRNIVSALCATSQAIQFPTNYRPRVFGDDSQARSIITPLESPIEMVGGPPPKQIPEGYLQIWYNRRVWVQDALEGANEIAELKFSLRSLLFAKVVECVKPNDIDVIEDGLLKLEARLLSLRPSSIGG